MDSYDVEQHEAPPRTLGEVLGKATTITGLAALSIWSLAAAWSTFVIVAAAREDSPGAVGFALVEMGAALVALAALGLFATALAFLITHAARRLRPDRPHDDPPADAPFVAPRDG